MFVTLTDGRIPIQTLNFYALSFAAVLLLIAQRISVFNFAMTVASTLGCPTFSEVPASGMIYGGTLLLRAGFWLTRKMSREPTKKAIHPWGKPDERRWAVDVARTSRAASASPVSTDLPRGAGRRARRAGSC